MLFSSELRRFMLKTLKDLGFGKTASEVCIVYYASPVNNHREI